jgi:hypothetical protein
MFTGNLEATSNAADWIDTFECVDSVTSAAKDLTGASILLAVRPTEQSSLVLEGSLTDGHISITGAATDGIFKIRFPKSEMLPLAPGFYDCGITITFADGTTEQIFAGQLPVIDGIVQQ